MHLSSRGYDQLSRLYNRYWGREYPESVMRALDILLLPDLPERACILDLCCGTGHLAKLLASRDFRIVGIDLSPSMLMHARVNAPESGFVAADARRFSLRHAFDAVVSTFESMNHFLDPEELSDVFSHVESVLLPGGAFLFDLLTEETYRSEWGKSSSIVEEDTVCIIRGGYEPEKALAHTDITSFALIGRNWDRVDVIIHERCYPVGSVFSLLEKSGFAEICDFDAGSLGMTGSLAVGRKFILAKKQGG